MTNRRFYDNRISRWDIVSPSSQYPLLVVCPKCSKMATVHHLKDVAVCSCLSCGLSKKKEMTYRSCYWYAQNPRDGIFDCDLWLQTSCCGDTLWAFSEMHLLFLEAYVQATLRQRSQNQYGWSNSSLASRLPLWMKKSKNRARVLKGIKTLKDKLNG